MKKSISALGLVAIVAATAALSGCNRPTYDASGSILTYTDATGNVVSYTASDLLKSYQEVGSSASTEFDKVYEVLVRKYYESSDKASKLETLKNNAKRSVESSKSAAKASANTNNTTYGEEFQKILDTAKVKNEEELLQKDLYDEEKSDFETTYNTDNRDAMRDGSTEGLTSTNYLFAEDANYGRASKGWIKETMPYHVRHILVKVSAAAGAYTQAELTESSTTSDAGEATKLATTIMRLAGADTSTKGVTSASSRESFGEIAKSASDDSSSAAKYGETGDSSSGVVTKSTSYVSEFKLGMYAYDSLYNNENVTSTDSYTKSNIASLVPGLKEDATEVSSANVNSDEALADGTSVYDFFKNGETYDNGDSGIGQIPYGAAVALLKNAKVTTDANGNPVYESNATFYPRNVLFNKYFNKHNICVITPNEIASNMTNPTDAQINSYDGEASTTYENLPGFKNNTTDILPEFTNNVLTDSEGQIVLVARAGTTGSNEYQGVHFIVIQRSALDNSSTADTPNLSQYYTMYSPSETGYPTTSSNEKMDTFVNYNTQVTADLDTRANNIKNSVKSYNGSESTYIFKDLVDKNAIKFTDSSMEKRIQTYSETKRQSTVDDAYTTWCTSWKTYAELLESQKEARSLTFDFKASPTDTNYYAGSASAKNRMLSEKVVVEYSTHSSDAWKVGGECYYVK